MAEALVLKYCDINEEVTIQWDASDYAKGTTHRLCVQTVDRHRNRTHFEPFRPTFWTFNTIKDNLSGYRTAWVALTATQRSLLDTATVSTCAPLRKLTTPKTSPSPHTGSPSSDAKQRMILRMILQWKVDVYRPRKNVTPNWRRIMTSVLEKSWTGHSWMLKWRILFPSPISLINAAKTCSPIQYRHALGQSWRQNSLSWEINSSLSLSTTGEWQFEDRSSSPRYPQCKNLMKKQKLMVETHFQPFWIGVTHWQKESSPAQKVMGRRTRALLHTHENLLKQSGHRLTATKPANRKARQVRQYNRKSRPLWCG